MIKDVCFKNRAPMFSGAGTAKSGVRYLGETCANTKLWGRLEGAALYGSSKAY